MLKTRINLSVIGLISLLSLVSFSNIRASHAAGGEITYQYIGDSTGVPHQYIIRLKLYRNVDGISLDATQQVDISSSCYGSQYITLNKPVGASHNTPVPGFKECIDPLAPVTDITYYTYEGQLTLPGPCSNYVINWTLCCRNGNISNLASYPELYIEAKLDNTLGPNTSPEFQYEGVKVFCLNQNVNWSHSVTERDGDSVFYELAPTLEDANTPIAWANGFSTQNPISTGNNPVQFNQDNGLMTFIPIQPEVDVFRISVSEFRYDTVLSTFRRIGKINRDAQVVISNACIAGTNDTIEFTLSDSGPGGMNDIPCNTKDIHFTLDRSVSCSGIAADGSDFALFDSNGLLMPIESAGSNSCGGGNVFDLYISLYNPISYNDTILFVTRKGSDNNTLITACDGYTAEFDSLLLTVTSCNSSIGFSEVTPLWYELFPNPVKESLWIQSPNSYILQYKVINLIGETVLVGKLKKGESISTIQLAPGQYTLIIDHSNNPSYHRFTKL